MNVNLIRDHFTLQAGADSMSPADGQVRYFGALPAVAASTTPDLARVMIPVACKLIGVSGHVLVAGTLGTTENSTYAIRKNDTTDTNISTTVAMSAMNNLYSNAAMDIDFVADDWFEVKVTHATFATNPTNVYNLLTAYFRVA